MFLLLPAYWHNSPQSSRATRNKLSQSTETITREDGAEKEVFSAVFANFIQGVYVIKNYSWWDSYLLIQSFSLYLVKCFIDRSKSWLFVIMENSPVPMENEYAFVLSFSAVAAIDAVVWTVVPLAGEHMEAFCDTPEPDEGWTHSYRFVSELNVQHTIKIFLPGLWWNMMLRRSWSPQVILSLYFWRRGIKISSQGSNIVVMSF